MCREERSAIIQSPGRVMLHPLAEVGIGMFVPVVVSRRQLVMDILRHCKGETVSLGIIDSYNPGIIVDSEQFDKTSEASPLFLIMPMRLSED
mgnify:CR=1 FL=1